MRLERGFSVPHRRATVPPRQQFKLQSSNYKPDPLTSAIGHGLIIHTNTKDENKTPTAHISVTSHPPSSLLNFPEIKQRPGNRPCTLFQSCRKPRKAESLMENVTGNCLCEPEAWNWEDSWCHSRYQRYVGLSLLQACCQSHQLFVILWASLGSVSCELERYVTICTDPDRIPLHPGNKKREDDAFLKAAI